MLLSFLDIGCAISASDGSSPQVYVQLLVVDHRLERNVSSGLLESSLSKICLVEYYQSVEENWAHDASRSVLMGRDVVGPRLA